MNIYFHFAAAALLLSMCLLPVMRPRPVCGGLLLPLSGGLVQRQFRAANSSWFALLLLLMSSARLRNENPIQSSFNYERESRNRRAVQGDRH